MEEVGLLDRRRYLWKRGKSFSTTAGAGNSAVTSTITNADHYLNQNQARIMMGGSGGSAACQSEGFGGGIVILDFNLLMEIIIQLVQMECH
ncbi:MAG: hypothetical protein U0T36_06400 [Saprospiraceae bacterium]